MTHLFQGLHSLPAIMPALIVFGVLIIVHEFGHFFATLHHRVRATLPYYIPVPPLPFLLSLGTLGAVIKIKEKIPGTKALFDIGIAGPLSGFAVCSGLLVYGFLNLPPANFIYTIHPEYLTQPGIQIPVDVLPARRGQTDTCNHQEQTLHATTQ